MSNYPIDPFKKPTPPPPSFLDALLAKPHPQPPPSPKIQELIDGLLGAQKPPPPKPEPSLLSMLSEPPFPLRDFDPKAKPSTASTIPGGLVRPQASAFPKHKAFVSFHHANDEAYKNRFVDVLGEAMDGFESQAVGDGDIDPCLPTDTIRDKIRDEFIRDATVTVVLIGIHTWQRRHVDWEIGSSIRTTKLHRRCGLIGVLLPTHPSYRAKAYDKGRVPPRLHDNQKSGYARIYDWTEDVASLRAWIHEAFERRSTHEPDNSYPSFGKNKTADRWD